MGGPVYHRGMTRALRRIRRLPLLAAPALACLGCAGPVDVSPDSVNPQGRTIALARISESPTEQDIPVLIESLTSADPAQRMLAIRTLERMTGETLDYRHYDPEWIRRDAVARWRDWWLQRSGAVAEDAEAPA